MQSDSTLRFALVLAAIVAVGCWLRASHLGDSLWLDELHTDWAAAADLAAVADRAAQGNQPPLYFWLIWLVRGIASSEVGLRLPSLIASCLLPGSFVILAKTLGKDSVRPSAVLLAAWWWASDDVAIFFGQEARPYSLVQCVAMLQFAAAWRLATEPTRASRALFWLLSLVLVYLHYTAGLLLIGELAAYCIWQFASDQVSAPAYRGKQVVLDAALFGLLLLPAVGPLAAIVRQRDEWRQFVTVPSAGEVLRLYPALIAAPILLLARRKTLPQLLLARTFLLPCLLALLLTAMGVLPLFFPRYLAALLPLGWLLIGLLPNLVANNIGRRLLTGVLILAPLLTNHHCREALQFGRPVTEHDEDWRAAAAFLRDQVASADAPPLLVAPRLIEGERLTADSSERFRQYLLFPVRTRYDFGVRADEIIPLRGPPLAFATQADRQRVLDHGEAWVLVRVGEGQLAAAQVEIREGLATDEFTVETTAAQSFGGLQLYRIVLRERKLAEP